jgi:hypothetical protein
MINMRDYCIIDHTFVMQGQPERLPCPLSPGSLAMVALHRKEILVGDLTLEMERYEGMVFLAFDLASVRSSQRHSGPSLLLLSWLFF